MSDCIRGIATLGENLSERVYRLRLANGKELLGHLPKGDPVGGEDLQPGDRVLIEVSPYDFSHARIARKA